MQNAESVGPGGKKKSKEVKEEDAIGRLRMRVAEKAAAVPREEVEKGNKRKVTKRSERKEGEKGLSSFAAVGESRR